MAVIKSGASSDALTIDSTSKAARVTPYDSRGNNRGTKATYRASTATTVAAAAGAASFFAFFGSSTKTIIVQRIVISGLTLTAVAYGNIVLEKWSTAFSGGTSTDLTKIPMDSTDSASTASICKAYTVAPTEGSLVGPLASKRVLMQATTAAAAGIPDVIEFDLRTMGSENTAVILRGISEGIGLAFGSAPATAVTLSLEIEWTEES